MFTNITIGKYIYKDSLIHKLNPLFKIISIIIILISSLIFNLFQNICLFIIIILISYLTKIDKKTYLNNLYGLRFFLTGILLIYIISKLNFLIILNNIFKIIINILITSILMYTTTINELNYGLNKILRPLRIIRIDYNKLSVIIVIAIKFIFLVFEETDIIFKAFKNRNLKFDGNILNRIKKVEMFLSTLFYLLIKKADNISNTLIVRNCELEKLILKNKYKINYVDVLALLNIILIILLIGVI